MPELLYFTTLQERTHKVFFFWGGWVGISLIFYTTCVFAGLLARQRKGELKRLNEQLLQINAALKRQAKIESYAPSLSYAPAAGGRIPESELIVDPRKEQLISCLRSGKSFLRNQGPQQAFLEFKKALDLAKDLKDSIEEKKAARGLGVPISHTHPLFYLRMTNSLNIF